MKLKNVFLIGACLLAGAMASNAATYQLINVQGDPAVDTLFANNNGTLMSSGTVAIGYWSAGVTTDQINTIEELVPLLASFTAADNAVPGASVAFSGPGYLAEDPVINSPILAGNPLIGKGVYVIATSAASLAAATINDEFSVFFLRNISEDSPIENTYTGNPLGATIIIGTSGVFTGDAGFGQGNYATLQMAVIPEPSAALLGAVGALGLLRRRRN